MYTKFFVRPGENEWIRTQVTLAPEQPSALHGTVKSEENRPVAEALVMLFETTSAAEQLKFAGCMFTDETGEFAFGPLLPGQLYVVKVFKNSVKLRELEIVAE